HIARGSGRSAGSAKLRGSSIPHSTSPWTPPSGESHRDETARHSSETSPSPGTAMDNEAALQCVPSYPRPPRLESWPAPAPPIGHDARNFDVASTDDPHRRGRHPKCYGVATATHAPTTPE